MPVHESTLRRWKGIGQEISTDRPCRRCGYNLIGLRTGQPCPECGTPIRTASLSGRFADNLVDAPLGYLRLLRTGLLMLCGSILLGVTAGIASFWFGAHLLILAGIACGPMWLGGTWFTTSPRPAEDTILPDPILDHEKLRMFIRVAQSVCLLAGGLLFAGLAVETLGGAGMAKLVPWLYGTGAGTLLLAAFALIPFGVYLSALSDWAGHGPVSVQFRISSIVIAVFGGMGLVLCIPVIMNPTGSGVTAILAVWSGGLTIIGTGYFLLLVLRLANSARWAVSNALEAMARDARVAERKAREADEMASRMQRAPVAPKRHLEKWESEAPIPLVEKPERTGEEQAHS